MANVYIDLPLPAGNGPGPSVPTATMGAQRTIVAGGSFPGALITVEISNDGGSGWAPICSFADVGGERVVAVAAQFMRVAVRGRKASVPFAANVDVSSNDIGGAFASIPLPAGNGAGAPIAAAALGSFATFVVAGTFPGAGIAVEISEDGNTWQPAATWAGYGGAVSLPLTAFQMRTFVSGRKASVPFAASVAVGAVNDPAPIGGITELTADVTAGPGSGAQAATVVGLQGSPVSAAAPVGGDVLTYNGGTSTWEPAAPSSAGITELTSDVTAGPGSGAQAATVVGLQGSPVSAAAPVGGDVLTYNGGTSTWEPAAPGFGTLAVVFDDSVPGTNVNIRSDRAANQSPIDNTRSQITNLGSQDGLVNPAATGATADGATIGGGDDNTASGIYATVPGGAGNLASGPHSLAGGVNSTAQGDSSFAFGNASLAASDYAFAAGLAPTATGIAAAAMNQAVANADGAFAANGADALGVFSFAEALGIANGVNAHAEGLALANGDESHAEGNGSTASGNAAHAEGRLTLATGLASHAEGNGTLAGAASAHAEGDECDALGVASHAEGVDTTAQGIGSHAQGNSNLALGDYSHVEGQGSEATGAYSHAQGVSAASARPTQDAFASGGFAGVFAALGTAQTSVLVMRGETPGVAPSEAVELTFGVIGADQFSLEDKRAYAITITAVAGGTQAGPAYVSRAFEVAFNALRIAGVTTITAIGAGAAYGDASTATWTLTPSVGAAPDRIVLTFDTGAGPASACYIAARMIFTEVQFTP